MKPLNFGLLYQNLTTMFSYDDKHPGMPTMERPSTFKKLIQILTKVNGMIRINELISGNQKQADEQAAMSDIIEARLSPLAFNAFKSLPSSNSGVPQDLATPEDMIKFKNFLVNEISSTPKTTVNRRRLAELTVARLILFNRRRASEVSNLEVSQWRKRSAWKKRSRRC